MALFDFKKKKSPPVETEVKKKPEKRMSADVVRLDTAAGDLSHLLKNPRITEKATMHSSLSVYTFDVSDAATKRTVQRAIQLFYNVTPRKVAIVPIPTKVRRNMRTGKRGVSRGGKKAYVYLKKGETITIS